ncbi:serine/threonine-protein kinase KIN2 [Globomyces sp. JEL0801]|nr:serine/threonine-protein kinase KIN2 [Globomyces sp. JEL0801]
MITHPDSVAGELEIFETKSLGRRSVKGGRVSSSTEKIQAISIIDGVEIDNNLKIDSSIYSLFQDPVWNLVEPDGAKQNQIESHESDNLTRNSIKLEDSFVSELLTAKSIPLPSSPKLTRSTHQHPTPSVMDNSIHTRKDHSKSSRAIDTTLDRTNTYPKTPPPIPARPTGLVIGKGYKSPSKVLPKVPVSNGDNHKARKEVKSQVDIPSIDTTALLRNRETVNVINSPNSNSSTSQMGTIPMSITKKQDSSSTVVEQVFQKQQINTEEIRERKKMIGKWEIGRTIGEGATGKVKLAVHCETKERDTNATIANGSDTTKAWAKVYKRELYMIREAVIGMKLNHPNIVKLNTAVLGDIHFYCFFELAEGEDLVDYISREGPIEEGLSRKLFFKVLSAIDYCHKNHVVHRDIKLENIRYNRLTGDVKILDFGFATFMTNDTFLRTNCGSPCYAAPEIYDNKPYDGKLVDVWSLGVCLFGMVTGTLPFDGPNFTSLAAKVRKGRIDFPPYLSKELVILISGMLCTFPSKRYSLDDVIKHTWTNLTNTTLFRKLNSQENKFTSSIDLDWVLKMQKSDDICKSGRLLMQELQNLIILQPTEVHTSSANVEISSSDGDSLETESRLINQAEKFVSNMTIKDRARKTVWWRRLWRNISNIFKSSTSNMTETQSENSQVRSSYQNITQPETHPAPSRFRRFTESIGITHFDQRPSTSNHVRNSGRQNARYPGRLLGKFFRG